MFSDFPKKYVILLLFAFSLFFFSSCETGVEDSPDPGVVRITLQADPSNTFIVNRSDTFSVYTPFEASFNVNTFQGSAFSGDQFAILFRSITSYAQEDSVYQIIEYDINKGRVEVSSADSVKVYSMLDAVREVDRGNISTSDFVDPKQADYVDKILGIERGTINPADLTADYKKFTLFESFVPPGKYDKIKFGLGVPTDVSKARVYLKKFSGEFLSVPLEIPPDDKLLKEFDLDFNVESGRTTQINVIIVPFTSLTRYKDSYRFSREMHIKGVEYF